MARALGCRPRDDSASGCTGGSSANLQARLHEVVVGGWGARTAPSAACQSGTPRRRCLLAHIPDMLGSELRDQIRMHCNLLSDRAAVAARHDYTVVVRHRLPHRADALFLPVPGGLGARALRARGLLSAAQFRRESAPAEVGRQVADVVEGDQHRRMVLAVADSGECAVALIQAEPPPVRSAERVPYEPACCLPISLRLPSRPA